MKTIEKIARVKGVEIEKIIKEEEDLIVFTTKCNKTITAKREEEDGDYNWNTKIVEAVENKWIKRERQLEERGLLEYIGKNKVLRKVGDDYLLFDKPNITNIRESVPDLVMERLKGSEYESKNLLFLNNLEDRNIFYIDAGDEYYDCLAIIVDNIPVAIPVPVIMELYNCSREEIDNIYNQKISKEVWAEQFATFYTARV